MAIPTQAVFERDVLWVHEFSQTLIYEFWDILPEMFCCVVFCSYILNASILLMLVGTLAEHIIESLYSKGKDSIWLNL